MDGMKSIAEHNKKGMAEDMKSKIFEMDWVFSSWFDKLFLVAMLLWSAYSLWRMIF